MQFRQLEAFYWLVQFQSYERVAEHLRLTQPAITARISGLEDSLGFHLVDRTVPTFTLTEQGIEVLAYAEEFMNLRESMIGKLVSIQKKRFTIGIVGIVALTWANDLYQALAEEHPDLVIDFNYAGSGLDLRQKVKSGSLDMAFVTGESGLPGVSSGFTVKYKVGWAGVPSFVEGINAPLTPDQIRQLPVIMYPKTSPLFTPVAEFIKDHDGRPNSRHAAISLSTICDMVRRGYGIAALPITALEPEIDAGSIVEIATTRTLPFTEVRCVHLNRGRREITESILRLARNCAERWCIDNPRYCEFIAS